jgi:hypothetical protein
MKGTLQNFMLRIHSDNLSKLIERGHGSITYSLLYTTGSQESSQTPVK